MSAGLSSASFSYTARSRKARGLCPNGERRAAKKQHFLEMMSRDRLFRCDYPKRGGSSCLSMGNGPVVEEHDKGGAISIEYDERGGGVEKKRIVYPKVRRCASL